MGSLNSSKGFSAIQTVLVVMLSGMVALGLASVLYDNQTASRRNTAQLSRLMVTNNIRFSAGNFIAINRSAFENNKMGALDLAACVCGKSTCGQNVAYNTSLYDATGAKISGTADLPVYFDTQGRNCSPDQEGCILKATSQVTCLGTNCGNSTGISETDPILRISYSVSPIDPQKIRNLGPMPVLNGPDIDIMVNTVRDYAIDKNLCVRVLGITPDNGPIAGGNDIAIQGSGLNKVLNIYIDGQTCQIKSQDPATLTCTAPPQVVMAKKMYSLPILTILC